MNPDISVAAICRVVPNPTEHCELGQLLNFEDCRSCGYAPNEVQAGPLTEADFRHCFRSSPRVLTSELQATTTCDLHSTVELNLVEIQELDIHCLTIPHPASIS